MPRTLTMTVLIVGASGATGKRLLEELLTRGIRVRAIVRSEESLTQEVRKKSGLRLIIASVLEMSEDEMQRAVHGCDAVVSCLGHNLTFQGIFGKPRRLVTEATRRLCQAIQSNDADMSVKFILMNTVVNRNRDLNERLHRKERLVISLLRMFLPPHPDNEQAAEYLRTEIGQNDDHIQWVAVRPSALIDADVITEIRIYESPVRSFLNDGQISRINVGNFMADLITLDALWSRWKGKMPVIYNKDQQL